MSLKKIALLGSTGSIGCSTLDVIAKHPGRFEIVALAAYSNVELLCEQYLRLRPKYVGVVDLTSAESVKERLKDYPVEVVPGETELIKLAGLDEADIIVNAIVGAAGLKASLEAVNKGKILALANKESLVTGGPLFTPIIEKTGAIILPIDSEHSAIWQALACGKADEVRNIILTASGGPFRELPTGQFETITPEMALKHPTWKMGPKITIDSATLANKGLEVIEAAVLFSVPVEKIKVVIHPQSIIHSMVEFIDSSIMAQMSRPDMRLPISYALFWPERVESDFGRLDVTELSDLTFDKPDLKRFPILGLAYAAARAGSTAPAVYNAANEIAVGSFLKGAVPFTAIAEVIEKTLNDLIVVHQPGLDDILAADRQARESAGKMIEKLTLC